jgi:hypothetical protein
MRCWGRRRRPGCQDSPADPADGDEGLSVAAARGAQEVQGSSLRGDSESHVEVMTARPQHNSARSLSRRLADVSLLF